MCYVLCLLKSITPCTLGVPDASINAVHNTTCSCSTIALYFPRVVITQSSHRAEATSICSIGTVKSSVHVESHFGFAMSSSQQQQNVRLFGDQIYDQNGRCLKCGGYPKHHRIFVCNRPSGMMPCMLVSMYRLHASGVLTMCSVCPRHQVPPPYMGEVVPPR